MLDLDDYERVNTFYTQKSSEVENIYSNSDEFDKNKKYCQFCNWFENFNTLKRHMQTKRHIDASAQYVNEQYDIIQSALRGNVREYAIHNLTPENLQVKQVLRNVMKTALELMIIEQNRMRGYKVNAVLNAKYIIKQDEIFLEKPMHFNTSNYIVLREDPANELEVIYQEFDDVIAAEKKEAVMRLCAKRT